MKINQSTPLFSIITVCRNSEKTIEQTIKSVLGQTVQNLEYIIIDGASDDNTLSIINKYRDQIDVVISEADAGIYDAMNKGIALSKGEVIGIINSDDWYEPNTLELVAEAYEKSDKRKVIHGLCKYYENGREGKILGYHHDVIPNMMIAHPTVFVPSFLYDRFGDFNIEFNVSADYELMLRFFTNTVQFSRIERVLANFRSGGISDIKSSKADVAKIQLLHGQINLTRYRIKSIRICLQSFKKSISMYFYRIIFHNDWR